LGCVYSKAIENDDSEENTRVTGAVEAREQLHMRLQGGDLRASGLNSEGQRTEIPPVEWQDISLDNWDKDANSVFDAKSHRPLYADVSVRRQDVIMLWPEQPASECAITTASSAGPAPSCELEEFLKKYIQDERQADRPPTQNKAEEAALAAGYRGVRGELRLIFKKIMGNKAQRVGRPRKTVENSN